MLKNPPTTKTAGFRFYDIECLNNVFTVVVYQQRSQYLEPEINIYVLSDNNYLSDNQEYVTHTKEINKYVRQANPYIANVIGTTTVSIHDLHNLQAWGKLADDLGGFSVKHQNSDDIHDFLKLLNVKKDSDIDYHYGTHPFIVGYNSQNYDLTVLSDVFGTLLASCISDNINSDTVPQDINARQIRLINDELFNEYINYMPAYLFKGKCSAKAKEIYYSFLKSGRHVDAARLNETQQKVALKRLLGQMGHQIKESDKLSGTNTSINNVDELYELIAYNVSDAIGTSLLFDDKSYSGAFDLKAGLLYDWPDTVFEHVGDFATAQSSLKDPDPKATVRRDRLIISDTSAKFSARILAPYRSFSEHTKRMADTPCVNFYYPHPDKAYELTQTKGYTVESKDMLDDTYMFLTHTARNAPQETQDIIDAIYDYYAAIRGKNFNKQNDELGTANNGYHSATRIDGVVLRLRTSLIRLANYWSNKDKRSTGYKLAHKVASTEENNEGTIMRIFAEDNPRTPLDNEDFAANYTPFSEFELLCSDVYRLVKLSRNEFDKDKKSPPPGMVYNQDYTTGRPVVNLDEIVRDMGYVYNWYLNQKVPLTDKNSPNKGKPKDVVWPIPHHADWDNVTGKLRYGESMFKSTTFCYDIADIPRKEGNSSNIFYINDDGTNSSGYVNLSIGGIHGAECNMGSFAADNEDYQHKLQLLRVTQDSVVRLMQSAPREALTLDSCAYGIWHEDNFPRGTDYAKKPAKDNPDCDRVDKDTLYQMRHSHVLDVNSLDNNQLWYASAYYMRHIEKLVVGGGDGDSITISHKDVLVPATKSNPEWRDTPKGAKPVNIWKKKSGSGKYALDDTYAHTTVGDVIHEDFKSYYPLLLVNLKAFENPDLRDKNGVIVDRYSQLFQAKEDYGAQLKDPNISSEEKERIGIMRSGVKLILNSASGAADTNKDTPIRMNNRITQMRVIGQLCSWRIGQAQTSAGATIGSTNTDGLYSMCDWKTNNQILDREVKNINVDIEPEPLTLISKDSNNRMELVDVVKNPASLDEALHHSATIAATSGAALAAFSGPNTQKSLDHPAMVDRLLGLYFVLIATEYIPEGHTTPLTINDECDTQTVYNMIDNLHQHLSVSKLAHLYQHIATPTTRHIIYGLNADIYTNALDTDEVSKALSHGDVKVFPHYNRMFFINKDAYNRTVGDTTARNLYHIAGAGFVKGRKKPSKTAGLAERIVRKSSLDWNSLSKKYSVSLSKQTNISADTTVMSMPLSIHTGENTIVEPETGLTLRGLIECVDTDYYVSRVAHVFNTQWKNS